MSAQAAPFLPDERVQAHTHTVREPSRHANDVQKRMMRYEGDEGWVPVNELEPRGARKRACEAPSAFWEVTNRSLLSGRSCYVSRVKARHFLRSPPRLLSLSQAEGARVIYRNRKHSGIFTLVYDFAECRIILSAYDGEIWFSRSFYRLISFHFVMLR